VQLLLAEIEHYGLLKKMEALEQHSAGSWIEPAAAERGLEPKVLVAFEGLRQLWGWLDQVTTVDTKNGDGLTIAEQAIEHFDVPLALVLAHFISKETRRRLRRRWGSVETSATTKVESVA
jgi:hypothetical protein